MWITGYAVVVTILLMLVYRRYRRVMGGCPTCGSQRVALYCAHCGIRQRGAVRIDWVQLQELRELPGVPRQDAFIFGSKRRP